MKKMLFTGIILFIAVLAFMAFNFPSSNFSGNSINPPQEKVVSPFPDSVAKVLENSCYDCHSDASSNMKALGKMNLSRWNEMDAAKKVAKLQDMIDILKKGDMPPAKYVEKFPDRTLGKEQKDLIINWANTETDKLMGN